MYKTVFLFLFVRCFANAQEPTEQWLSSFNGQGDFSEKFNCVAVDDFENSYLAGYTVIAGNKKDYLTVKLSPAGDTLWTRTMDGLGNGDDEILALTIDASGNVYVTGYSKGNETNDDYLTIKYNDLGSLQWSARYNHSSNQDDQANSIAVDLAGNVFVTGQSDADPSAAKNDDYATIMYSSDGIPIWEKRYDGNGASTDRAVKIMVGNGGDVFVTGRSDNGSNDDFVTIKYTSNGTQIWLKVLDRGGNDKAEAMILDAAENVYVTGRSDNGSNDDYLTIKYSNSGDEIWPGGVLYDGVGQGDDKPTAIAVDGAGNVYLTGRSDGAMSSIVNYNFVTLKYNAAGNEIWTVTYNGTGDGSDTPSGIALDIAGNVIVCGQYDADPSTTETDYNSVVVSYSSEGMINWEKTHAGTANDKDDAKAIVVDLTGNVYIAGMVENLGTQKDALMIKYSMAGNEITTVHHHRSGDNSDHVNAMMVDTEQQTYLAGYSYTVKGEKDFLLIKLAANGDTLWTRTYNGSSNNSDEAEDLVIDASGNTYVTGYCKESISGYNFITRKYSPTGALIWSTQYNNSAVNGSDKAKKIALDALGNVYVTGYSDSDPSEVVKNEDFLTIKYNPAGIQIWTARFNGAGNSSDVPCDLKVDNNGNVFVTGKSSNGLNDDFATLKYNASGVLQFQKLLDGLQGDDKPKALKIDESSNVFVTGTSFNGTYYDFRTVKYNASGVEQWNTNYVGANGDTKAVDLALDGWGNCYVSGTSSNGMTDDITTIKYNGAGEQQWLTHFDGSAGGNDQPKAVKVDHLGSILVAGETNSGTLIQPDNDYLLLKYQTNGDLIWKKTYAGPHGLTDGINTLAIDDEDNLYISGNSSDPNEHKNIVSIKYNSPVGLEELVTFGENQLFFPNPFSTFSTLDVKGIEGGRIELFLFDLLGQRVQTVEPLHGNQLTLDGGKLARGTYTFILYQQHSEIARGKIMVQ
jgi:uncharacterized delta-60 repeat protein